MEAAARYPARGVDGGHEVESYELEFSTRIQCSPAAYYWATVRKARDTLKGPIKGAVRRASHYTRPQTERVWHVTTSRVENVQWLGGVTNEYLYEQKALKTKKVYHTWAKCSANTEDPHREWCRKPGCLVGTTSGRPRGGTGETIESACP